MLFQVEMQLNLKLIYESRLTLLYSLLSILFLYKYVTILEMTAISYPYREGTKMGWTELLQLQEA